MTRWLIGGIFCDIAGQLIGILEKELEDQQFGRWLKLPAVRQSMLTDDLIVEINGKLAPSIRGRLAAIGANRPS